MVTGPADTVGAAKLRTGAYVAMCAILAGCVVTMTVCYVKTMRDQQRKWDEAREKMAESLHRVAPPEPPPAHTDN